jgi:hypothetical protein
MNDPNKTKRDIDTLLQSIRLEWVEHAQSRSAEERAAIRNHIAWCIKESADLITHV